MRKYRTAKWMDQWSDEDEAYVVMLPEFGGCMTHGDTYELAVKHGREVLELLVESYAEEGRKLPKPARVGCLAV